MKAPSSSESLEAFYEQFPEYKDKSRWLVLPCICGCNGFATWDLHNPDDRTNVKLALDKMVDILYKNVDKT